jgi:hypothetical protein
MQKLRDFLRDEQAIEKKSVKAPSAYNIKKEE